MKKTKKKAVVENKENISDLEFILENLTNTDIKLETNIKPLDEKPIDQQIDNLNQTLAQDPIIETVQDFKADVIDLATSKELINPKIFNFTAEQVAKQKAIINAAMFVAGNQGLNIWDLKRALYEFDLNSEYIHNLIRQISIKLSNSPTSGLMIQKVGEHYKYYTKKDYNVQLAKIIRVQLRSSLTPTLLEVLAIIAYNQPCTKGLIEKIRNTDATNSLLRLIDLELIKKEKQATTPGKPWLYEVTAKFFDIFGLKNLSQLPKLNTSFEEINEEFTLGEKAENSNFFNINRTALNKKDIVNPDDVHQISEEVIKINEDKLNLEDQQENYLSQPTNNQNQESQLNMQNLEKIELSEADQLLAHVRNSGKKSKNYDHDDHDDSDVQKIINDQHELDHEEIDDEELFDENENHDDDLDDDFDDDIEDELEDLF